MSTSLSTGVDFLTIVYTSRHKKSTVFFFPKSLAMTEVPDFVFWSVYFKTPEMQKYYFCSMTLFEHGFSINLA